MDADNQAQRIHGRHPGGGHSYKIKNKVLINIVERYLPWGLEAWREVAEIYQRESGEETLYQGDDVQDYWNKNPSNSMQRPTGQPGAVRNCTFCCIEIEHRIQDVANLAILGVDLAESSHSHNDGDSVLSKVIADGTGANCGPDGDGRGGPPVTDIHFNVYCGNQEGNEENKEVAAATDADVNAVVRRR
jgi:hypothetical protein